MTRLDRSPRTSSLRRRAEQRQGSERAERSGHECDRSGSDGRCRVHVRLRAVSLDGDSPESTAVESITPERTTRCAGRASALPGRHDREDQLARARQSRVAAGHRLRRHASAQRFQSGAAAVHHDLDQRDGQRARPPGRDSLHGRGCDLGGHGAGQRESPRRSPSVSPTAPKKTDRGVGHRERDDGIARGVVRGGPANGSVISRFTATCTSPDGETTRTGTHQGGPRRQHRARRDYDGDVSMSCRPRSNEGSARYAVGVVGAGDRRAPPRAPTKPILSATNSTTLKVSFGKPANDVPRSPDTPRPASPRTVARAGRRRVRQPRQRDRSLAGPDLHVHRRGGERTGDRGRVPASAGITA